MVAGRLLRLPGRKNGKCILNENVQDEAEPKLVLALANSLLTGRIKYFILESL